MSRTAVAAIDLGATSGRVMVGHVGDGMLRLDAVARFANTPVHAADGMHWDFTGLYDHAVDGLAAAARAEPDLASVGIDAWAVDYGLVNEGRLLAEPFHYRDERTARGVEVVHARVPFDELYRRNGLQFLPFNTLYQYAIDVRLAEADSALLIPDLIAYLLTGTRVAETTNASTTGLVDPRTGEWDTELIASLGFSASLFPPLIQPGTRLGPLQGGALERVGAPLEVIAVGSHDTASAVVAVPMRADRAAYISCGTWGLVGVELDAPVLTGAARAANFTNEGGVDGRVRFLHNVMGLWLLSESVRAWEADDGAPIELTQLLDAAASVTTAVPVFDADDPRLLPAGDMPGRIAALLREGGLPVPATRAAFARSIIESIADAFARAVHTAAALSGRDITEINLVGGGALNGLLCQATADRSGLPVLAGPVEATALGNVLIQARAQGAVEGDLEALRALVAAAFPPRRYTPRV